MKMSENQDFSSEHARLVKVLIDELKNQGFEILNAVSDGYQACSEVEGVVPDVKAYNRKKQYVVFGLAKTCEELTAPQTEEQFKVLANRYMPSGKSARAAVPFCIAITKGCENQLEASLKKLNLDQKKNVFLYAF